MCKIVSVAEFNHRPPRKVPVTKHKRGYCQSFTIYLQLRLPCYDDLTSVLCSYNDW